MSEGLKRIKIIRKVRQCGSGRTFFCVKVGVESNGIGMEIA